MKKKIPYSQSRPFNWSKSHFMKEMHKDPYKAEGGQEALEEGLEEFFLYEQDGYFVQKKDLSNQQIKANTPAFIPREAAELLIAYYIAKREKKNLENKMESASKGKNSENRVDVNRKIEQKFINTIEKSNNSFLKIWLSSDEHYRYIRVLPVFIQTFSHQISSLINILASCSLSKALDAMQYTIDSMEQLLLNLQSDYAGSIFEQRQDKSKKTREGCDPESITKDIYKKILEERKKIITSDGIALSPERAKYPTLYKVLNEKSDQSIMEQAEQEFISLLCEKEQKLRSDGYIDMNSRFGLYCEFFINQNNMERERVRKKTCMSMISVYIHKFYRFGTSKNESGKFIEYSETNDVCWCPFFTNMLQYSKQDRKVIVKEANENMKQLYELIFSKKDYVAASKKLERLHSHNQMMRVVRDGCESIPELKAILCSLSKEDDNIEESRQKLLVVLKQFEKEYAESVEKVIINLLDQNMKVLNDAEIVRAPSKALALDLNGEVAGENSALEDSVQYHRSFSENLSKSLYAEFQSYANCEQ